MQPPETFKTARLELRRSRAADAEAVYRAYAADPEVTRYLIWRPHRDLDETRAFFAGSESRWDRGQPHAWMLWLEEELVGSIALRPETFRASVGFVLARSHWNRGLMTEALATLVDWSLAQPDIHRIWAVCDVDNPASARVMEKTGMQREGILRRWIVHPNVGAEPRDCYCYAAIR